ncbi:hypothetical protein ABTM87_20315, partial [Acinetobacter baumannii]
ESQSVKSTVLLLEGYRFGEYNHGEMFNNVFALEDPAVQAFAFTFILLKRIYQFTTPDNILEPNSNMSESYTDIYAN